MIGKANEELISVIVPVYNVREYIDECLQSITNQSYTNLEIILIDDGSTDGSSEVCDEWAYKDSRIISIHQKNVGVSNARNKGLKQAGGEYIGFIDPDDWIEKSMYQKLAESLMEADFASCGYVEYPMGNLDVKVLNGTRPIVGPCSTNAAAKYIYEREGYLNSVCNKLFRRRVIFQDRVHPLLFEEDLSIGEDEVWLARVLHESHKVSFVPEALYNIRPRKESATRKNILTEREMTVFTAKEKAMRLLPQEAEVQNLCKAVLFNDCYSYKVLAYCIGDKENFKEISEILRSVKKHWIRSDKAKPLFKLKVYILEAEMSIGLPRGLVNLTYNIKRFGVKHQ